MAYPSRTYGTGWGLGISVAPLRYEATTEVVPCPAGTVRDRTGVCVPFRTCPTGMVMDSSGRCVCAPGYEPEPIKGGCAPIVVTEPVPPPTVIVEPPPPPEPVEIAPDILEPLPPPEPIVNGGMPEPEPRIPPPTYPADIWRPAVPPPEPFDRAVESVTENQVITRRAGLAGAGGILIPLGLLALVAFMGNR